MKVIRNEQQEWIMINLLLHLYADRSMTYYQSWKLYDPRATEILKWCRDNLQHDWFENGGRFFFRDEKDAAFFTLRWT